MSDTFLLNDFYTITQVEVAGNTISAGIFLNEQHPVFKGHFEQMPIVPGVFQTQLIKEVLQQQLGENLQLTNGNNIKFMGMIIPGQHPHIQLEINYKQDGNKYTADARLFSESTTFTKFKGTFTTKL